jgi:hypothetical protein
MRTGSSVDSAESYRGLRGIKRSKWLVIASVVVLFLTGMVVTSLTASAGWCNHTDHGHPHNGHQDWYHWHTHYQDAGIHFEVWHNHTHDVIFHEAC